MSPTYSVEPLGRSHDRQAFSCGNVALDQYLRERALQDQRRNVAFVYVMIDTASQAIAGYYTLSATAVDTQGLAPGLFENLPSYRALPATLLGRLARDLRFHGAGVGSRLLFDALARSLRVSQEIASLGVIVDAIDETARLFYERYGFTRFLDDEYRLILPMGTIRRLIEGQPAS